ncbi:DUF2231 domain-containing protein [Armatimonas sp.]|uniref:DUF2231 domain-containing protein n=1 Tax=Armatimonas sp. TaxID=1872638 RepID=UPI003750A235
MPQEDPIKLWQHLHGATVHFALALTLVSFAFDLGSKIFGKKEWRTVGFWALVVAVTLSLPAIYSGFWGQLGWFRVEKWEADHLLPHRNFALGGTIGIALLLIWRSATRDFSVGLNSNRLYLGYLVLMLAATIAIGYTGYLGSYVARTY